MTIPGEAAIAAPRVRALPATRRFGADAAFVLALRLASVFVLAAVVLLIVETIEFLLLLGFGRRRRS